MDGSNSCSLDCDIMSNASRTTWRARSRSVSGLMRRVAATRPFQTMLQAPMMARVAMNRQPERYRSHRYGRTFSKAFISCE